MLLEGRPALGYDALSLDVGITPSGQGVPGALEHATPVKPVSTCAPGGAGAVAVPAGCLALLRLPADYDDLRAEGRLQLRGGQLECVVVE